MAKTKKQPPTEESAKKKPAPAVPAPTSQSAGVSDITRLKCSAGIRQAVGDTPPIPPESPRQDHIEEIPPDLPDVTADIKAEIAKEIKAYECHSNWASRLGHPCVRYLVHCRLDWDKVKPISVEKRMLFDGGNVLERYVAKVYLEKAGYIVLEQQKPTAWKEKEISGRLDFEITHESKLMLNGKPYNLPVEVKTMEHHTWQKINCIEDMLYSKKTWHRNYPGQLTCYLLSKAKPLGMFLMISKLTYEPKHIWLPLDYTFGEELIQKAEIVNSFVAKKEYPKGIDYDESVCRFCDFQHLCLPDIKPKGAEFLDDEHWLDVLERHEELKPLASEYKALDEDIKEFFSERDVVVGGTFRVFGKFNDMTKYDIPDDIKAKYARKEKVWKKIIQRLVPEKK